MDRNTPHRLIRNPTTDLVVGYMRRFARRGAEDLELIALVKDICKHLEQGDYAGECLACYYWVCQNVRYMRDGNGVETVQTPQRILDTLSGDCDDMSTLLAAMFLVLGNRCRFVLVGFQPRQAPSHVFTEVVTPQGRAVLFDPVPNRNTRQMLSRVQVRREVPV